MKRLRTLLVLGLLGLAGPVEAGPADDLREYRAFFQQRFPQLTLTEFADGAYMLDPVARSDWEELETFPPYEAGIERGRVLFERAFANGRRYADCFENGGIGIAQNFPYFDAERKTVVTLPLAINECRTRNGEDALAYGKGALVDIEAYMVFTSRGKPARIEIPDDPAALAAYNAGKSYYFTRRGQLDLACKHCHFENAGRRIRTQTLSPALGQTSNWPTYRLKWGEIGSLHRRFRGCNRQIRAKFEAMQSETYRNLEYFLRHMGNGVPVNGPSIRY